MAFAFYVTDVMHGKNGNDVVALALRDTSASTKDVPAAFMQTSALTSAFAGITEYGMLITNSQTTKSAYATAIRAHNLANNSIYYISVSGTNLASLVSAYVAVGMSYEAGVVV